MGEVEKEEDWKDKIDFTTVEKEIPKEVIEKVCGILDELITEMILRNIA